MCEHGQELILTAIRFYQCFFGQPAFGDIAESPDATHDSSLDGLYFRKSLNNPSIGEFENVGGLRRRRRVNFIDPGVILLRVLEPLADDVSQQAMLPGVHDLAGDPPHLDKVFVEVGDHSLFVRDQNCVGRGFQRRTHHRERLCKFLCFLLQRLLRLEQFLFGTLTCDENAAGILKGDRSNQVVLPLVSRHSRPPRNLSVSLVPSTLALILAKAVSRLVEVSSLKGENPQSSVVPSCSIGRYSAASSTRSRTSSGVSMCGSMGAITPTKTRSS